MTIDKLIEIASSAFPEDEWDLLRTCEIYKIHDMGFRKENSVDYIVDEERNTITRVNYLKKVTVTKDIKDIPEKPATCLHIWLCDRNTGAVKKRVDDPTHIEASSSGIIIGHNRQGGSYYTPIHHTRVYISLGINDPEDFYPGMTGMIDHRVLYRKPHNFNIFYSNVDSLTYLKSYDLMDNPVYAFDLTGSYKGEDFQNRIALDICRKNDQLWL